MRIHGRDHSRMSARVFSRATTGNARRFPLATVEAMPFPVASIQVDGVSAFAADFERANRSARIEFRNPYSHLTRGGWRNTICRPATSFRRYFSWTPLESSAKKVPSFPTRKVVRPPLFVPPRPSSASFEPIQSIFVNRSGQELPPVINRRKVILGLGSGTAGAWIGRTWARRGAAARVVVVGGGFAGASCALALKAAAPSLSVALVERLCCYATNCDPCRTAVWW